MTKLETLRAGFDKIHRRSLEVLKELEKDMQDYPDYYDFSFDADEAFTWIWERL